MRYTVMYDKCTIIDALASRNGQRVSCAADLSAVNDRFPRTVNAQRVIADLMAAGPDAGYTAVVSDYELAGAARNLVNPKPDPVTGRPPHARWQPADVVQALRVLELACRATGMTSRPPAARLDEDLRWVVGVQADAHINVEDRAMLATAVRAGANVLVTNDGGLLCEDVRVDVFDRHGLAVVSPREWASVCFHLRREARVAVPV